MVSIHSMSREYNTRRLIKPCTILCAATITTNSSILFADETLHVTVITTKNPLGAAKFK
jgi:hypothetical protein